MITVVCVCWGSKFPIAYVHNLKSMVERNTTVEHNFVCFSDRPINNINTKILRKGYDGWWNKLQMFDTSYGLSNRVIYFDLDTLIVNNIDWLMNYQGMFMGIEDVGAVNKHQPHLKNKMQSAVMSWNYPFNGNIWTDFISDPTNMNRFRGDGEYLNAAVSNTSRELLQKEFPGKLKSYKYQVYDTGIDDKTSIVCFHGRPSIIEAMSVPVQTSMQIYEPKKWIKDYWR